MNSPLIVIARRFRKPPWVPPSASKIFRVPKPKPIDPVLKQEMEVKFAAYNSQLESIVQTMKASLRIDDAKHAREDTQHAQEHAVALEAAQQQRKRLNEEWNAAVAPTRLAWMREQEQNERALRLKAKLDLETQRKVDAELCDNHVMTIQEHEAPHILKREQLEEAIERALDAPKDYNFAVDGNGNMYKHGEMVGNLLVLQEQQKQQNSENSQKLS